MGQKPDAPSIDPEWRDHAEFTLFFDHMTGEDGNQKWQTRVAQTGKRSAWRTRVYHQESDTEHVFEGVEPTLWVNWILEHAQLTNVVGRFPADATDATAGATEQPVAAMKIDSLEVQVYKSQPSSAEKERNLTVEVHFQVVEAQRDKFLEEGITYQVELHAINLGNNATRLVALERGQIQPGVEEYISKQVFPMLDVGRYELQSIVLLMPPADTIAVYHGPIITVIP